MNRIICIVLSMVVIIASNSYAMQSTAFFKNNILYDWHICIVDGENDTGYCTSIDTHDNDVYISYLYNYPGFDLRYAYLEKGKTWKNVTVDYIGDVGASSTIKIDNYSGKHIIYTENYNVSGSTLKYAYKSISGSWKINYVEPKGCIIWGPSLTIDANNNLHLCYINYTSNMLKYAYKPFLGNWSYESIDNSHNDKYYCDITVDSKYGIHVSYIETLNTSLKLKYAYKPMNGTWSLENISNLSELRETSMDVDSADKPHISYYPYMHLNHAYKLVNGTWANETIDHTCDCGQYSDIFIDDYDNIHIGYYDYSNDFLKYAYKNSTNPWAIETVDNSGQVGEDVSIVVDDYGVVHLSYHDRINKDLMYATNKPTVVENILVIVCIVTFITMFIVITKRKRNERGLAVDGG